MIFQNYYAKNLNQKKLLSHSNLNHYYQKIQHALSFNMKTEKIYNVMEKQQMK